MKGASEEQSIAFCRGDRSSTLLVNVNSCIVRTGSDPICKLFLKKLKDFWEKKCKNFMIFFTRHSFRDSVSGFLLPGGSFWDHPWKAMISQDWKISVLLDRLLRTLGQSPGNLISNDADLERKKSK